MKFCFGDIVVVHGNEIGVVVKSWKSYKPRERRPVNEYDVYVRMSNGIETLPEDKIQRYAVRHKYLNKREMEWQHEAQEE